MVRRSLALIALLSALLPTAAGAHGAMQKMVEKKFLLNLTSAPIAPYAGQEQQNIFALSDFDENLITQNAVYTVEIRKKGKKVFGADSLVATGGLLPFKYTYAEPGMYELFTTIRLPNDSHLYEPEDYFVQVVPAPQKQDPQNPRGASGALLPALAGFLAGCVLCGIRKRR